MPIDAVRSGIKGLVLGTGLEEWMENAAAVMEVIVNNIDQEGSFHKLSDQLLGWGILFVEFGPLCTKFKCLILDSM